MGIESGRCWCSLGLLRNWQNEPHAFILLRSGEPHTLISAILELGISKTINSHKLPECKDARRKKAKLLLA